MSPFRLGERALVYLLGCRGAPALLCGSRGAPALLYGCRGALLLLFGCCGALLLLFNGCDGQPEKPPPPAEPVEVQVVQVRRTDGTERMWAAGLLQPGRRATVSTRLSGEVVATSVAEGDRVQRGDLLLTIDTRGLKAKVRSAQVAVAAAVASLNEAEKNLGRMQRLHERELIATIRLEEARLAVARAKKKLAAARAQQQEAAAQLDYGRLRAPFSGVVVQKLAGVGDLAAPGRPLLILEDRTELKVVARISDETARALAVGEQVEVKVPSAELRLQGEVEAVLPLGEPRSPGFRVEVLLTNPGGALQPGASASVRVPTGAPEREGRVKVPAQAVIRRGQLRGVYVVGGPAEPGGPPRAELRWVVIEGSSARQGTVRVISGLPSDARVIVGPDLERLQSGAPVDPEPVDDERHAKDRQR